MLGLNFGALFAAVIDAILPLLIHETLPVASAGLKSAGQIVNAIVTIGIDYLTGKLTQQQAYDAVQIEVQRAKAEVEEIIGEGELLAQKLPTDILTAMKDVVNGALHFNLIP